MGEKKKGHKEKSFSSHAEKNDERKCAAKEMCMGVSGVCVWQRGK